MEHPLSVLKTRIEVLPLSIPFARLNVFDYYCFASKLPHRTLQHISTKELWIWLLEALLVNLLGT